MATRTGRLGVLLVVVVLLGASFLALRSPEETRTVTAHFPRAVSVYVGTDVRVLGVNVGRVLSVTPDGESVAVEMEYDASVRVPADARAAVVTPTLVADRFVQLTPAYSGGEVLPDDAEIALPDTGVPVELDRIYASLRDLSRALGPNGVNADGTLDNLLRAGAEALDGQGARGNRMLRDLADAATTFGEGSGDLFEAVSDLAVLTRTLAENDRLVRAFLRDLTGVSSDLAGERQELTAALGALSRAVGTVEAFVADHREALGTDVEKLTRVLKNITLERESLDTALTVAPVAMGNLALAFDNESNSIGSRIGIGGNIWDADGFLCSLVQQSQLPRASKELACTLFEQLLEPVTGQVPFVPPPTPGGPPAGRSGGPAARPAPGTGTGTGTARGGERRAPRAAAYVADPAPTLAELLGGGS